MSQKGHESRAQTKKSMNHKEHEPKRAGTKKSTNQKQHDQKGHKPKEHEPKRGRTKTSTNQKVVSCGKLQYFNQNTILLHLGIETLQITAI